MSLPSQKARPKSRRSHMYSRRRRHPLRWGLGILGAVAVAVGFWWLWPQTNAGENSNPPLSNTGKLESNDATNDNKNTRLAAASDPVRTEIRPTTIIPPVNIAPRTQQSNNPADPPKLVMGEPQRNTNTQFNPEPQRPTTSPGISSNTPVNTPAQEQNQTSTNDVTRSNTNERPANQTATTTELSEPSTAIANALASLNARPVESRIALSRALNSAQTSASDQQRIREALTKTSDTLVFSSAILPDDPFVLAYTVQSGDLLQKIVKKHSLQVDWRFISRINNIDPRKIRVGQRLKLITGPFHCIVDKSDFRLDLYLGDGSQQVYVRSFDVGLGEYNSTPVGLFRVKSASKAVNPAWANPRTGEKFDADDPANPIGEHWIGLEAVDDALKDVIGYGIHGTTDPDSIGQEKSMGCVRLRDEDVELLYEVLVEETSLVRIVP